MTRNLLALGFVAVGVAALCYAARGEGPRPLAIVAAMLAFFAAANLISRVAALAARLQPFVGKTATVRAWGSALPEGETFEVASVRAISAGLHIYLRPLDSSKPIHLKIAQPRDVQLTDSRLQITDAKYIQWAGHKLERNPDHSVPAFVMQGQN